MIKKAFAMAAYNITKARDYIHSLEEPTKDLIKVVGNAIANGTLRGVEMAGQSLFLMPQKQLRSIPVKHDR